jgi:hypothetical protein
LPANREPGIKITVSLINKVPEAIVRPAADIQNTPCCFFVCLSQLVVENVDLAPCALASCWYSVVPHTLVPVAI